MKLKTKVGIEVNLVNEVGGSQILMFERPIHAIQLTSKESSILGSTLIQVKEERPMDALRGLKEKGFFNTPRTLGKIRDELEKCDVPIMSSSLGALLDKMIKKGELKRKKGSRGYEYYLNLT